MRERVQQETDERMEWSIVPNPLLRQMYGTGGAGAPGAGSGS